MPILAVAIFILTILSAIVLCEIIFGSPESQSKDLVSEPAKPAPVKKPVTAEQVLKKSASINISKQYHTDAIAMVKVIEQFPSKNQFIHSAIMYNNKIIEVSTSKYQPFDTKEIKLQQLNDVIQVLRQAINHKIPSIQIAYNCLIACYASRMIVK